MAASGGHALSDRRYCEGICKLFVGKNGPKIRTRGAKWDDFQTETKSTNVTSIIVATMIRNPI